MTSKVKKTEQNPFLGEFIFKSQGLYYVLEISERMQKVTAVLLACDLLLPEEQ